MGIGGKGGNGGQGGVKGKGKILDKETFYQKIKQVIKKKKN